MSKIFNFDDFKEEERRRKRKEWITDKVKDTANWVNNNKETLAVVLPVVVAGVAGSAKIVKSVSRNVALKQEKDLKERFIYDRSLGKYLELKKPLSNSQLTSILERKENGEKLSIILHNMGLLK